MSRFRVAFMGTPDFAAESLAHLIRDEHYEVVGVITQPDRPSGRQLQPKPSPVKALALQHQLEVLTPENVNEPEVLLDIAKWRAEVGVVVAFGQILSKALLDLFPFGCVNVHGSLLPRWRGAAPIQRALMAGDAETGVSLQRVVRALDAGDVLGLRRVPITPESDAAQLFAELKKLGADLLHVELMDYLRGNLVATPQDEALVTIAPKIQKNEAQIHWQRPASVIFNQVRALTMGPVSWTSTPSGARLKIWCTRVVGDSATHAQPGSITINNNQLIVRCGRGELALLEVQPENKARMKIEDYLRGYTQSHRLHAGIMNEGSIHAGSA